MQTENKITFESFKKSMNAAGYYVSDEFLFVNAYLAVREMESIKGVSAIVLDGDAGTGKTFLGQCIAKSIDATLLKYQLTYGSGVEDLLFDLNLGNVIRGMRGDEIENFYLDGILPEAIKKSWKGKVVLLIDEIDKASPKIDAFLLDFLENGEFNNPHTGLLKANSENLIVVITKNNERVISEPLIRRCRRLYLDYPAKGIEEKIILKNVDNCPIPVAKLLIMLANKIRAKKGTRDEAIKVPSTPELIRCARDICLMKSMGCFTKTQVGEIVKQWLIAYIDDKNIIEETCEHVGAQIISFFA